MAIWSEINASILSEHAGRIDPEYYRPETLHADLAIKSLEYALFGKLVSDGYRVVYENTKILNENAVRAEDCRFLQATNISQDGLSIEQDKVGYVSVADWIRYPKGRIKAREILIEVKGQAEKVAIVPDYYPARTLVSGTLFKATIKNEVVSPEYIYSFFLCHYGKLLRARVKTNTLIAFVSKPELYRIPVPIPSRSSMQEITSLVREAINQNMLSQSFYTQAQQLLKQELGLDKLEFKKSLSNEVSLSEITEGRRIDAQCYKLDYVNYEQYLRKNCDYQYLRSLVCPTLKGKQMSESSSGSVHYASIKDIQGIELLTDSYCTLTSEICLAKKKDLLLAITGATIGKIGLVNRYERLAFCGDLLLLRANENIDPHYLLTVMQSPMGQSQCKRWITGSTNGHLAPHDVGKLVIPRLSIAKENVISECVKKCLRTKRESEQLLEQAKCQVEELIQEAVEK